MVDRERRGCLQGDRSWKDRNILTNGGKQVRLGWKMAKLRSRKPSQLFRVIRDIFWFEEFMWEVCNMHIRVDLAIPRQ